VLSLPMVSIYVPAAGTAIVKAPVLLVVATACGDAGTPHGLEVAVCAALHVALLGNAPTTTVKPLSATPELNSAALPLTDSDVVRLVHEVR